MRNKFNRKPNKLNREMYKKQRNKCVKLRKRSIKTYIENITKSGVMSSKTFWCTVRPFLTNRGVLIDNEISLIYNGKTIDDEKQVVETLNHAYINIVKHTTGIKPTSVLNDTNIELSSAIDLIVDKYETQPSTIKIKDSLISPTCFFLNKVNVQDIEKIIKKIKVDKASGEDKIPQRLVKMASNFLSEPITNIINTYCRYKHLS